MLNRFIIKEKYNFIKPPKQYTSLVFYTSCFKDCKTWKRVSVNCRLPYGY